MLYARAALGRIILRATAIDTVMVHDALQQLSSLFTEEGGSALGFLPRSSFEVALFGNQCLRYRSL